MRRFVTMDETWIHQHTPETKQPSKQSKSDGASLLKCEFSWLTTLRRVKLSLVINLRIFLGQTEGSDRGETSRNRQEEGVVPP